MAFLQESIASLLLRWPSPLIAKCSFRAQEPIAFKCGTLVEIYKGRGPTRLAASSRGIIVSDVLGKHLHKFLRCKLFDQGSTLLLDSRFCGIPGRSTDFAHLCLRLHGSLQALRHLSSGQIFVDLVAAFNRVIRELAIRIDCSDEAIVSLFRDMGLPPEVYDRFRTRLLAEPIFA